MVPSRIVVLPSEVIDQIAAGEVVERSASVVKELVENSLDAGARRIDVQVEQAGRKLLRVVDDGGGMTPDELTLCSFRHATSKLRSAQDLATIHTMGFRGEALPSIAAVSRMSITSRRAGTELGACLSLEPGQPGELVPAGTRTGTIVEVRSLFFNVPARLKFQKSTATENTRIQEAVQSLALGFPAVHFTLASDGRKVLDLPPAASRLERCRAVLERLGEGLACDRLDDRAVQLEVCLAQPHLALRTARQLHLVVNGRAIRDRQLIQAVLVGHGQLLERGRYPVGVLYLDLAAEELDVNVHPQKTEVRFLDPTRLFGLARRVTATLLARAPWVQDSPSPRQGPSRVYPVTMDRGSGYEEHKQRIIEAQRRFFSTRPDAQEPSRAEDAPARYQLDLGVQAASSGPRNREAPTRSSVQGYFSNLRLVGGALGLFIVCEGENELVLVDQHAAHERVTFEKLRSGLGHGQIPAQRLLVPVIVQLGPDLGAAAEEHAALLLRLGVELEPFGSGAFAVRSMPIPLRDADPGRLVQDLLHELEAFGESQVTEEMEDRALSRIACHGSVRAGRTLTPEEMTALLRALDQVDFSSACPHGRPVMIRMPRGELESRLRRT